MEVRGLVHSALIRNINLLLLLVLLLLLLLLGLLLFHGDGP